MKAHEDQDAPEVITGIFSLYDIEMHALIDPGSTHSYVCIEHVFDKILPAVEQLAYDMHVISPLGHNVIVNSIYRNCPIVIQTREFLADLITLPFREFDLILGMDWLSKHRAIVDCGQKTIVLRCSDQTEVIVQGIGSSVMSNVISTMQARRFMRKGWRLADDGAMLAQLEAQPVLKQMIINAQKNDEELQKNLQMVRDGDKTKFLEKEAGSLNFQNILCVPDDKELKQKLLYEAHNTVFTMHPGGNKMYHDLKQFYWWKGMKRDVTEYVSKCLTCQQVKAEHQVPTGLLNPLPIPQWKWDNITMDFVSGFPLTQQKHDYVWVIVDRLTKSAHFILVRIDYSMDRLTELYVDEIVRLHGVPLSIVSDRDPRFTSRFWKELQSALGTKLKFSTAFHPQTDGQSERLIQVLEDMLRGCVIEFSGNWDRYIPLMEFAYNNSFQSSIGMAPYEALYGRKCRTPMSWT